MAFMSKAQAEILEKNAVTINAVVTSSDDRTPPASDGKTKLTLAGFENALTDAVAEAGRVFKATYNSDPLIEKVNEYVTYDRSGVEEKYSVKGGTALPYQVKSTATPDPKDDTNLQSVGEVTEDQLYNSAPKPYQAGDISVVGQNYLYDGDAHFTAKTATVMPASPYSAPDQFKSTFGLLPFKEGETSAPQQEYWFKKVDAQGSPVGKVNIFYSETSVLMGPEPDENFIRAGFDITQDELNVFSVENMKKLTSLKSGDRVRTKFFNVSVVCLWEIKETADVQAWEFSIDLDNGLKAVLFPENFLVNVDQFGAFRNDLTNNSGLAFNAAYRQAFMDPRIDKVSHGSKYMSSEQIDVVNGQQYLDPSVTNYDLTFSLEFNTTYIEFTGGTAGDGGESYVAKNRTDQRSIKFAQIDGMLHCINKGNWDYGIVFSGINWGNTDDLAGTDFLITSVSYNSNNGKGGLWGSVNSLYGSGGEIPVVIGQTANANVFNSVFSGYGSKCPFECYAARTQINRLSIENTIDGKEETLECCARFFASANIDTLEMEMNGVTGATKYVGALVVDGSGPDGAYVAISNPTFVAVGTRFTSIDGGIVYMSPKQNTGRKDDYAEIYSNQKIRAHNIHTARENVETTTSIVSGSSYGSYETISAANSYDWVVDPVKITLDNSSGTVQTDFQIRTFDFDGQQGPSTVFSVDAGQTKELGAQDLLGMVITGRAFSYVCRCRNANSETVSVKMIERQL